MCLLLVLLLDSSFGKPKSNNEKKEAPRLDFNALFRYLLKHFPATPNLKQLFGKPQKPNAPPPSGTTPSSAITTTPGSKKDVTTCREEFRDIPGHTMCMPDNVNVSPEQWGVSETEKNDIVKQHNMLRGSIEPPAADLLAMKWDDRLAEVAEKWAKQCVNRHDKVRSIPTLGSTTVGQNVAGGQPNWTVAIQAWWDEIHMWKYGPEPDSYLGYNGWLKVGHFTQMAQNGTYLVGCGFAVCENEHYRRYYVCNYAAGQSDLGKPYTLGERCSKCPKFCKDGLCDCGSKKCNNGGTLNPETCECECKKIFSGPSCDELVCPEEDMWFCGKQWTPDLCDKYANIPYDCPYMCGTCKASDGIKSQKSSNNGKSTSGFTSTHGCKYSGKRASAEECKKYGENGKDISMCGSNGGSLTCKQCDQFSNVRSEMCPIMCGLCDPPCNGKVCSNGGTLDSETCECACAPPYLPPTCDKADCSKPDNKACPAWPNDYCSKYANVPEKCPKKCGICP